MRTDFQLSLFAAPAPGARSEAAFLEPLPRALPAEGIEREAAVRGLRVRCVLRRSGRARSVRLLVDRSARLTVVVPRRVALRDVPAALEEHAAWIARTIKRQRRRGVTARPAVTDGGRVVILGVEHALRLAVDGRLDARPGVTREDGALHVRIPPLAGVTATDLVRTWLRDLAGREIPARVSACAAQLGFASGRVSVRDQRTKWGACSGRGDLSFNWRLVLAPSPVLDYVIVHELCHLRELNHSPRFWRLVRGFRPDYEDHRRWLRDHGESLDL